MRSASEAVKWPSSWTKISRPSPTTATKKLTLPPTPLRRSASPRRPPPRARPGRLPGRRHSRRACSRRRRRMSRKPTRPLQECGHGDLVRRVEGAREGPAALAGLAREGEQRERVGVGCLECEREPGELERRDGRRRALGVVEGVRDRDSHVGVAGVRECGAVAESYERVHDRVRMHDNLDPLVRDSEEPVRLDQLQPLVRKRCTSPL